MSNTKHLNLKDFEKSEIIQQVYAPSLMKSRGKEKLIGELDKAGKNVKTANGWVPVKGNEHLVKKKEETKNVIKRGDLFILKTESGYWASMNGKRVVVVNPDINGKIEVSLADENMKQDGTHLIEVKRDICMHCKKEFALNTLSQYHNENCKYNPNITQQQLDRRKHKKKSSRTIFPKHKPDRIYKKHKKHKPMPRGVCFCCGNEYANHILAQFHNDKCKLKKAA